MKILLIGNFAVKYRGSFISEYLVGKQIAFYHIDKKRHLKKAGKGLHYKIYRRLYNYFVQLITFLRELYLILWADNVYILPMNNDSVLRLRLIKLFNKKLVVDFYVSEYDTYVNDRKTVAAGSKKAEKLKKLDALAMRLGDKVLFFIFNEKAYYTRVVGIENTINDSIVPLAIPERPFAVLPWYHQKTGRPTICWWGSFLNLHGLETMIDGIELLYKKGFQASFHFFGVPNHREAYYRSLIEKKGLSDYITLRTDLNFENGLIEFLTRNCDLALGQFGTNAKASNVLVNKIVDATAMQLPVLTRPNPAVKEFFDETSLYFAEPTPESFASKIETIFSKSNREKAKEVAQKGRIVYNNNFTPERFQQTLEKILISLNG